MTTLAKAVEVFVRDYPQAHTTGRDYALTLRRCAAALGPDRAVADVAGEDWHDVLIELWGHRAANTWNRNHATVKTFLRWLGDAGECTVKLPALCKTRTVVIDETKAREPEELEHLWDSATVGLRERTLWRLLYESSSRAEAALSLNVESINMRRRKARAVIKGGRTIWVHFEDAGAGLLREYIGDRTRGPLFLTSRRPRNWRDRPSSDLAPDGRRYRLSYDRAEHILKDYAGITLHILRHSRLSYLSGEGVDTPMLMKISGHTNPATLHRRYARPSDRAVEKLFDRLGGQS